jgi:hypothetical protein
MAEKVPQHELPGQVRSVLSSVRRRIRAYVWIQGIAIVVFVAGVMFWLAMGLDRLFEPSPAVRQVGLFIIAAITLYVAWRYILRRIAVPISDASAAALLERRFPALKEHLITAVDVAARPDLAAAFHPQLVRETQQSAASAVADLRPEQLFNRSPLVRAITAAALVVASIALFAVLSRDTFGFWLERIAMSEEPWPRRVHLEVVGFPTDDAGRRITKVAKDDRFELLVHASAEGYEVPEEVEIRYRRADGRRGRDTMVRIGEASESTRDKQVFRYLFKRVSTDMDFDVVGGDDRVRDLQLQVVERPELFAIELECVYPDYLGREPRRLPVTGGMRIPEGSQLVLHAESTKPLAAASIHRTGAEKGADSKLDYSKDSVKELQWDYGTIVDDDVLMVSVTDTDGVASREPYRVSLAIVRDEVPQVTSRLSGIGTAITPDAVLPFVGKVVDDYGLDRAWFEYHIDGAQAVARPLVQQPQGEPLLETLGEFDLRAADEVTGQRAIMLTPGQRFGIAIKAADRFNLAEEPHAGSSQQYVLDVVSPADLLALLERRELSLRQRYEAIYEKMTDTRNLLARVDFDQGEATEDGSEAETETDADTPERQLARRRLRVAGSLQNVIQSADEVGGVAEAFDDLGEELTNNRIDNPDLQSRLREQIALPLHRIAEERMPQLAAQVKLVETNVADAAKGPAELTRSLARADEVLVEMKQVLDRMLELETYNEVVTLLRDIISDQEDVSRQTKEQRKKQVQSLIEDE